MSDRVAPHLGSLSPDAGAMLLQLEGDVDRGRGDVVKYLFPSVSGGHSALQYDSISSRWVSLFMRFPGPILFESDRTAC